MAVLVRRGKCGLLALCLLHNLNQLPGWCMSLCNLFHPEKNPNCIYENLVYSYQRSLYFGQNNSSGMVKVITPSTVTQQCLKAWFPQRTILKSCWYREETTFLPPCFSRWLWNLFDAPASCFSLLNRQKMNAANTNAAFPASLVK